MRANRSVSVLIASSVWSYFSTLEGKAQRIRQRHRAEAARGLAAPGDDFALDIEQRHPVDRHAAELDGCAVGIVGVSCAHRAKAEVGGLGGWER